MSNTDDESAEVVKRLLEVDSKVQSVEELVEKLEQASRLDAVADMTHENAATFFANLAYTLGALWFMRLRCNGVSPQSHAIMKELKRVSEYYKKIKKVSEPDKGPILRVDTAAAGRFIKHALAANHKKF